MSNRKDIKSAERTLPANLPRRELRTNRAPKGFARPTQYRAGLSEMWTDWKREFRNVFTLEAPGMEWLAGLTVAAVALPLNIALAVACELPPSAGLLAGAVGGAFAALFGGASLQVSGPAAALNFLVLALVKDFGAAGAAGAALIVGVVQLVCCFLLFGRFARFIPEAVLAGFMTGVGLKLLDNQIPELLGFDYHVTELAAMLHRPTWLHDVSWLSVVSGTTVALIVLSARQWKRFPAGLAGVTLVTSLSTYLSWDIERVGAISASLRVQLPAFEAEQWGSLILRTMPLAFLAIVESLLSGRAVDRLAKAPKPFNPNLELFGQGLGNLATGLVMGMPVTGVVVRSTVNVTSGAKSRLSSVVHSVVLFFSIFYLGDAIAKIPLAALAGLLCVVGFRLVEVDTLVHLLKSNRVAAAAFLVTAFGTVSGYFLEGLLLGLGIEAAYWWLTRKSRAELEKKQIALSEGVRAVLSKDLAKKPRAADDVAPPSGAQWQRHVVERPFVPRSAFVHPKASVIGRVVLGDNVHIAAGSSVRADEGTPFFIGDDTNVQDGVVVHALKDKWVKVGGENWAVYVGKNVSMAHQALVHGPCFIGDHSFIGFRAVVHDSIVGAHCYIGIGAVVVGVEVPPDKFVPHGMIVDTQEKAAGLPPVTKWHVHFNQDVVEVNRGLASAYRETLLQTLGIEVDLDNPRTAPVRSSGPYQDYKNF